MLIHYNYFATVRRYLFQMVTLFSQKNAAANFMETDDLANLSRETVLQQAARVTSTASRNIGSQGGNYRGELKRPDLKGSIFLY